MHSKDSAQRNKPLHKKVNAKNEIRNKFLGQWAYIATIVCIYLVRFIMAKGETGVV